MTERTYWIIMGAWTLVVIGAVLGMWWTIRKADQKREADEAFQNEILNEMEAFNDRRRRAVLPPPILNNSRDYEDKPFALDNPDAA